MVMPARVQYFSDLLQKLNRSYPVHLSAVLLENIKSHRYTNANIPEHRAHILKRALFDNNLESI